MNHQLQDTVKKRGLYIYFGGPAGADPELLLEGGANP